MKYTPGYMSVSMTFDPFLGSAILYLKSIHGWALHSWPWEPIAHFYCFNSIPHHCSQLVYFCIWILTLMCPAQRIVHINSYWIFSVAVKNTSASVFLVPQDSNGWTQDADWELRFFKVPKRFQCAAKVVQAPTGNLSQATGFLPPFPTCPHSAALQSPPPRNSWDNLFFPTPIYNIPLSISKNIGIIHAYKWLLT